MLAAACTQLPAARPSQGAGATEPPPALPSDTPPAAIPTADAACAAALPAVIPPTPIPYPGYVQVEPSTGLHVTAEPHVLDLATYRLVVKGKVARELSLTYDELRCLPKTAAHVTHHVPRLLRRPVQPGGRIAGERAGAGRAARGRAAGDLHRRRPADCEYPPRRGAGLGRLPGLRVGGSSRCPSRTASPCAPRCPATPGGTGLSGCR